MGPLAFFAVGCGAACGAWLRWALGLWLNPLCPTISLGTLAANLAGGYLMGVALAAFDAFPGLSPELRLAVVTGFLGGLTTFSAFSGEVTTLFVRQQPGAALGAVGLHVVGSLLMTWFGLLSVRVWRP